MVFKGKPKRDRFIRTDEVKALLAECKENDFHAYRLFRTMVATGMRTIEAVNLTVDDVDVDRSGIHIRTAKKRGKKHERFVSLDADSLEVLLGSMPDWGPLFLYQDWRHSEETLKPLNGRAVKNMFKVYGDRAGIRPELAPHSLRHFHTTQCLDLGMTELEVASRLGHQNTKTVMTYWTLREKRNQEMADKFGDSVFGEG